MGGRGLGVSGAGASGGGGGVGGVAAAAMLCCGGDKGERQDMKSAQNTPSRQPLNNPMAAAAAAGGGLPGGGMVGGTPGMGPAGMGMGPGGMGMGPAGGGMGMGPQAGGGFTPGGGPLGPGAQMQGKGMMGPGGPMGGMGGGPGGMGQPPITQVGRMQQQQQQGMMNNMMMNNMNSFDMPREDFKKVRRTSCSEKPFSPCGCELLISYLGTSHFRSTTLPYAPEIYFGQFLSLFLSYSFLFLQLPTFLFFFPPLYFFSKRKRSFAFFLLPLALPLLFFLFLRPHLWSLPIASFRPLKKSSFSTLQRKSFFSAPPPLLPFLSSLLFLPFFCRLCSRASDPFSSFSLFDQRAPFFPNHLLYYMADCYTVLFQGRIFRHPAPCPLFDKGKQLP